MFFFTECFTVASMFMLILLLYISVQLQKVGDSELLSKFTEENVIVLESRASGKTLCFREGEVEGTGGHGALGKYSGLVYILKNLIKK